MVQLVLRGLFILMTGAVAGLYASRAFWDSASGILLVVSISLLVSGGIILADALTPKKRLSSVSGVFLGLLVGMGAAYSLSFLVEYVGVLFPDLPGEFLEGVKVLLGVICVYGAISLVLQTKDDFRFVIPYVEFSKKIRGMRPLVLDTSVIIDGRILDIVHTQIMQGLVIVPRFVLNELQAVADSSDKLKRARGRRGLDIVAKLQASPQVDVSIDESEVEGPSVDQKLLTLSAELKARLLTTDFNLSKVADVRGVEVVNINQLAEALRPVVLPGERMCVKVVKPGESPGQGVGYLDDGTMVVVEYARDKLGTEIDLSVTSVLQTSAGRMIFGRLDERAGGDSGGGSGNDASSGGRGGKRGST